MEDTKQEIFKHRDNDGDIGITFYMVVLWISLIYISTVVLFSAYLLYIVVIENSEYCTFKKHYTILPIIPEIFIYT